MTQAVKPNRIENDKQIARRAAILRHIYSAEKAESKSEPKLIKVNQLVASTPVAKLEVLVLRRYPRRQINSMNYRGPVAAACGRDETGVVGLVLWGEQVDQVRTGDVVRITNGWCRRSHGEIVVSSGRTGQLSVIQS
ncbi:MAG: hypothetical protein HOE69_07770 [Euryarchaeota archaeon]|jgi:ssDNA-binding replication factor A large subunit|nr:hypothetical protein [Euryarchaeota archaeon]